MERRRHGFAHARFIILIAFLAALAGGGIFTVHKLISPAFLVGQIENAVRKHLGRNLHVGGQASVKLFPHLTLVLDDVRLSNPPDMDEGDFARVARLDMEVELWPLLLRRLVVRRLHLERPEIHLLVDGQGRNNWTFQTPATAKKSTDGVTPGAASGPVGLIRDIRLAPLVLREGTVLFDDRRRGIRLLLHDLDMTMKLPTAASPMELKGNTIWRRQRLRFALYARHPARLSGPGSPVEVFVKLPGARVEYVGLAALGRKLSLAGSVSASGESLRGLLHWLGAGVARQGPGLGKFSLQAALETSGRTTTLKKMRLQLDGSNAQGSARLDMDDKVTAITVALGVDRIITDTYLASAAPTGRGEGRGRIGRKGIFARSGWSTAPIIPDLPAQVRADVRLSVNELRHGQLKMGPGAVQLVLRNRRSAITLKEMKFYGGTLAGKLALTGVGRKPLARAWFRFNGVSTRPFLVDLAGFNRLSGRLSGIVDIRTQGRSQQQMAGNVTGFANFYIREGRIYGIDLTKLLEMAQKGLAPQWRVSEDAVTDFRELAAEFVIADGIATVRQLSLKGASVQVTGAGEIDLLRRWLDLSLDGGLIRREGGKVKLLKAPVPILVRGPWHKPDVYPDIAGILKNPQETLEKLQGLLKAVGSGRPIPGAERMEGRAKGTAGKGVGKTGQKREREVEKRQKGAPGENTAAETMEQATQEMRKLLEGLLRQPAAPAP